MDSVFFFLLNFYCIYGISAQTNGGYDAPQEIQIFHTIDSSDNPKWSEKGLVILQNINTGSVTITQPALQSDIDNDISDNPEDVLYRLKCVVRTSKGKETYFYSFMKLNSFLEAGKAISLVASVDQNGSLIGIRAYPELKRSKSSMNSTIVFKVVEQGPVPDTASYILKLEREREAKERGATQDNRSFFAKYWIYLVPVVLFAILSGSSSGEGGGSGR